MRPALEGVGRGEEAALLGQDWLQTPGAGGWPSQTPQTGVVQVMPARGALCGPGTAS